MVDYSLNTQIPLLGGAIIRPQVIKPKTDDPVYDMRDIHGHEPDYKRYQDFLDDVIREDKEKQRKGNSNEMFTYIGIGIGLLLLLKILKK